MQFPKLENSGTNREFKTPKFLRITEGEMVIRILGPKFYVVKTHWVNGVTTVCLDESCPICMNNDKIRMENPEDFRDVLGYIPWRNTFYTNVFDKTPIKVCPNCGSEVQQVRGIFPSSCWKCNTIVNAEEAQSSNTIKVLNRGKQLLDHLELVEKSVLDENGEPIGIENYDIKLRVGSNKEPIPIEMPSSNAPIDFNEEDLFDLVKVPLKLEAEEIKDLLRGVKVKDILVARSVSKEEEAITDAIDTDSIDSELEKATKKVRSIFRG